jgi:UPF0716 protein FxsA
MLSILLILFIILPLIELYLLIEIGKYFGAFNTVFLVIGTGIVGAFLAKLEGLRVWHSIKKDLQQMKMPGDKLIDGLLILVGGVTLLTPGILTDILGLLLIFPLTRPIFKKFAKKHFGRKMKRGSIRVIDIK